MTLTYDWNVSIPWLNTMGAQTFGSSTGANPVSVVASFYNNTNPPKWLSTCFQLQIGFSTNPYTYFAVDPAHPAPAPIQATLVSAADSYLLLGIIAIIFAIAIVGIVLALLVTKKRP